MKTRLVFVPMAASLLMGGTAVAGPQYYGQGYGEAQVVRCESTDGRYRTCAADTRGRIEVARQISRNACVEGRTWGVSQQGIWVNQGCRADFVVDTRYGGNYGRGNGYGDGAGQVIRCESVDGRQRFCAIDTRGRIRVVRQLSNSACIEGRSWGTQRGGIWVSQGCRADFQAMPGGRGWRNGWGRNGRDGYGNSGAGYGYGQAQMIQCASNDGRQNYCSAPVSRGVRINRQLSDSACIEGRTWGWDRGGVWVNQGCRAEFSVF